MKGGEKVPKFFVTKNKITDRKIVIDTQDVKHVTRVLRLKCGDRIEVCNSEGMDYDAEIAEITSDTVVCNICGAHKSDTEPNIEVTLFQAIPKAAKMDYIIQKTTELGISRIVPCVTARCVSKTDGREEKKLARWRKIAEEAGKQSGRGRIPEIYDIMSFDKAADMLMKCDIAFAPYECEQTGSLKTVLTSKVDVKTVGFMVGPEGGYDISEVAAFQKKNIPTVTLGPRILRTETAGEAVLAMVMYEIGDINKEGDNE
jgi:16S rRNA (uracil1498-N3)-methyltransferase